jgi:hypothetical protein
VRVREVRRFSKRRTDHIALELFIMNRLSQRKDFCDIEWGLAILEAV